MGEGDAGSDLSVDTFNRQRQLAGFPLVRVTHRRSAKEVECDLTSAARKLYKPNVVVLDDTEGDDGADVDFALACRLSAEQARLEQLNREALERLLGPLDTTDREHKGEARASTGVASSSTPPPHHHHPTTPTTTPHPQPHSPAALIVCLLPARPSRLDPQRQEEK